MGRNTQAWQWTFGAGCLPVALGLVICLVGGAVGCGSRSTASSTTAAVAVHEPAPHDFARWENEIAAFEAADKTNPPPKGGILFTGSSVIRLWKTLGADFPRHKVINRGFGGSEIADATHFADRIIFPYEPKQVFLRAGGNDIHNGRLPAEVAADFAAFVKKVHQRLPNTEIYFISTSPAPDRWGETDKYRELNKLIREMALEMPRVGLVNTFDMTITSTGQARTELFIADQLHFNEEGYKLLADRVRPFLPVVK
jgi:lysophospholipase L1-like esterase